MLDQLSTFIANYQVWLTTLAFASIAFLLLSIVFIPKVIARIPVDYFTRPQHRPRHQPACLSQLLITLAKNIAAVVLILAGILMLVLPGQGLLTLFAGMLLLDFPGKYRFERFLIRKPAFRNAINWIRRQQNAPNLLVD